VRLRTRAESKDRTGSLETPGQVFADNLVLSLNYLDEQGLF
jgi:hypothetical protein